MVSPRTFRGVARRASGSTSRRATTSTQLRYMPRMASRNSRPRARLESGRECRSMSKAATPQPWPLRRGAVRPGSHDHGWRRPALLVARVSRRPRPQTRLARGKQGPVSVKVQRILVCPKGAPMTERAGSAASRTTLTRLAYGDTVTMLSSLGACIEIAPTHRRRRSSDRSRTAERAAECTTNASPPMTRMGSSA